MSEQSTEYMDGWNAHKDEQSINASPYNEKVQAISHRRWVSGWSARFSAIKHGLDLSLDDVYE